MNKKKIDRRIQAIEDLKIVESSNILIRKSVIKLFTMNNFKNNKFIYGIFLIISLVMSFLFKDQSNKLEVVLAIVSYTSDATLVLLGIVFGGYTLFQAALSDRLIKIMLFESSEPEQENQERVSSRYVLLNSSFFELISLYIIGFIINYIIFLFLNSGSDLIVFIYSNCSFFLYLILFLYQFFFLLIFWEIKFFIFNIYNVINTSIALEGIRIIQRDINNVSKD